MSDHIVIAHGGTISHPHIVATAPSQRRELVNLALRDPSSAMTFHVQDATYRVGETIVTRRWLEVGLFAGFGGALFVDETTPEGDDWAWIALPREPSTDVPEVYLDRPSRTRFPPHTVMPVDELHDVILEWVSAGERPASVSWLAVNDFRWRLDGAGEIAG